MHLSEKIKKNQATVSVIGLGYVGLPLAVEFAKKGFTVYGIDVNQEKIEMLMACKSYIMDVPSEELEIVVKNGKFHATTDFSLLGNADTVSICVPTPLRKTRDPDISYIVKAVDEIEKYIKKGQLIVLESTTYPGTTEEVMLDRLQKNGLKVGSDFYLAFSPERVDPGNPKYNTKNTPKIIGGTTPQCTEMACALYSTVVEKVVPVTSTRAAEMVKLLENTFRAVNIALVNEVAIIANKLNLDVWEIIDAAATKPFGFMPFYPGPGLGGHCIPVDPQYLSWKLKSLNYYTRFIELAEDINSHMPDFVVHKITDMLNDEEKAMKGSKILVLGVAYKRDTSDCRESPALEVIKLLEVKGCDVFYSDDYVESVNIDGTTYKSTKLDYKKLGDFACVVITTNHSYFDYKEIVKNSRSVMDSRNATKGIAVDAPNRVVRL